MTFKQTLFSFILLSLGWISFQPAFCQQMVKNSSYDLMLKTLLSHSVTEISAEQAAKLNNAVFLDARAKEEFEVSHIKGATWVGYDAFKPSMVEDIDKTQPVVVYCSVGYRSEKISEQLLEMGFSEVSNLYGGIFEWVNRGEEVVNQQAVTTEEVHAYNKIWGVWLRIPKEKKVY